MGASDDHALLATAGAAVRLQPGGHSGPATLSTKF
jgi:hypothetical protein